MLTFRFALGRRLVTIAIPPYFLLLLLAVGLLGYVLGGHKTAADHRRQEEMLTVLKERNQQLERSCSRKEQERGQMADLAEARAEELWDELRSRDHELVRLWAIVGRYPQRSGSPRHTLASRSGSRRRDASIKARFGELQSSLEVNQAELRELATATALYKRAQQIKIAQQTPSIAPCKAEITSGFGGRMHPIYGISRPHNGCDFTTDYGTPIQATASGIVLSADWLGGYGKAVEIEHINGLSTLYAHCDTLKVKKGQLVTKGQVIATVGTTGLSSGPHCHYEVHKDGKPVNPLAYLPRQSSTRPR